MLGRTDAIGQVFDIGGPEVVTYRDMMATVARPVAPPAVRAAGTRALARLSSQWLRLVTDVDLTTARALVDSMTNEVIVHERGIDAVVALEPMRFETAAARALKQRAERLEIAPQTSPSA